MNSVWKKFLNISLWTVLIIFVIRCAIGWNELFKAGEAVNAIKCAYTLFGYAGEAIGLATVIMWTFNNWLWKWKPINYITGKMPVLSAQYSGDITFEWDNKVQKKKATLEINQKFLKVIVKLRTDESTSQVLFASIEEIHNDQQLVYIYVNEPKAELQDKSAIHYGTAMLQIDSNNALHGNYYTSRLTRGSLDFTDIEKSTAT